MNHTKLKKFLDVKNWNIMWKEKRKKRKYIKGGNAKKG